jgi:hypothetical protein
MQNQQSGTQLMMEFRPAETLIGLSCLVVELVDATLAERDTDAAQALIELAMCVLHTAAAIEPRFEAEMEYARKRLQAATVSVRLALPTQNDEDSDDQWPCRVV